MYRAAFERVSKVEYEVEEDITLTVASSISKDLPTRQQSTIDVRTARLRFVRQPDDGFEPRDHRKPPNPIS